MVKHWIRNRWSQDSRWGAIHQAERKARALSGTEEHIPFYADNIHSVSMLTTTNVQTLEEGIEAPSHSDPASTEWDVPRTVSIQACMVRWVPQRPSEEAEWALPWVEGEICKLLQSSFPDQTYWESVSPHLPFPPFSEVISWAYKTKAGLTHT